MIYKFDKINKVKGSLTLSGDKSISHRALIISALAKGKSHIKNLSTAEDVVSTIICLQHLGIEIITNENEIVVSGKGFMGLEKPIEYLNAGNSGTTARLLSAVLAAQKFESTIVGDDSLSKRPMSRVIEPLKLMGANISGSPKNTLPLQIKSADSIKSIEYELPVASAQVKSAVLLAGLHIEETTKVIELVQTRNHTENLLNLDVSESWNKKAISVSLKNYPYAGEYFIPGDISSSMNFIVLTLLTNNSELLIENVSINETRTAAIEILKQMGAKIEYELISESHREKYGNVFVQSSELKNIEIKKDIIPLIIDEIPILAVAGLFAEGDFYLRNASELRFKESDRITSLCSNFSSIGFTIEEFNDGFCLSGDIKKLNPVFDSYGDHRITMAFSVLASLLKGGGSVKGFDCVSVSNPQFLNQLREIIR